MILRNFGPHFILRRAWISSPAGRRWYCDLHKTNTGSGLTQQIIGFCKQTRRGVSRTCFSYILFRKNLVIYYNVLPETVYVRYQTGGNAIWRKCMALLHTICWEWIVCEYLQADWLRLIIKFGNVRFFCFFEMYTIIIYIEAILLCMTARLLSGDEIMFFEK